MPLPWMTWILLAALPVTQNHNDASLESAREIAARLEEQGRFTQASAVLTDALSSPAPGDGRRRELEFARERLRRIRHDYRLSADELFAALDRSLTGLTRREFDRWVTRGWFDRRWIDGEQRFLAVSVSNLYFRHPGLNARRRQPRSTAAEARAYLANAREIRAAAGTSIGPRVLPKRLQVAMNLTVSPAAVRPGDQIRCWLPVPRSFPHQTDFDLVRATPSVGQVAPESSPIRSAYFEQLAREGQPVRFEIEYAYTTWGIWFDLNSPPPGSPSERPPDLAACLVEGPHLVFTDAMRHLSAKLAGDEADPARRARRFYEWIADHIRYSYAREYSTIPHLGEYCLTQRYGDCGQATLLFMSLCRLNGIPARWQSGWSLFPDAETIHDWCEIWLDPWGWVPVDPYMGIFAMQYADSLSDRERRELRDFTFGGLTQYRMAANSAHSQDLWPAKASFRSDDVDFQRGEVEVNGTNVFFDRFSSTLTWREISVTGPQPSR